MSPIEGGSNSHTAQPFISTSAQSWAEADLASLSTGQVALNADKGDKQGPVMLGSVSSAPATEVAPPPAANGTPAAPDDAPKPESRVAAIGDSDFASNFAIGIPGNSDLFVNVINWLGQREDLIGIRAREPEDRRQDAPHRACGEGAQEVTLSHVGRPPGTALLRGRKPGHADRAKGGHRNQRCTRID
jgi:ABC-type uncharacterized transport system involved in gliding motility auxiliary subunit